MKLSTSFCVRASSATTEDPARTLTMEITIAKADGSEPFVSHDVMATQSLSAAAKAVGFYLTSVELRGMVGALAPARYTVRSKQTC